MEDKILPLGSIVYLKNYNHKVMVICRGAIFGNDDEEEEFFDYLGCDYPNGIDKEKTIFFNEDSIEEILFEGYIDETEIRHANLYLKWRKKTEIPKGNLK